MPWFEADIFDFFAELEFNNEKAWFEKNKKRYESVVKNPMEVFAAELITRVREIDPAITTTPKEAVFRIYRDVRFSKDKSPYKTNAGLSIAAGERGPHGSPGIYFHVDARCMGIASGYYMPDPERILAIRRHICANPEEFTRLLGDSEFKTRFGTISGEKNKVLSQEFRESAASQPLLFNKQFYYWAEYGGDEALEDNLPEFVVDHYRAAGPMNAFLSEAVQA